MAASRPAVAVPVWKASLADIENTSSVLVETNRKLAEERDSLNNQLLVVEATVTALRQENERQLALVQDRRRAISAPSDESGLGQRIARVEQEMKTAQARTSQAQSRLKAVDSRIALRKLKIQELELEKKALLLDRQARTNSTLGILKQSVLLLRDRIATQKEQIVFVRQKINELQSIDRPYLKEVRQYESDNRKLKADLAALTARRDELATRLKAAVDKKEKLAGGSGKKMQDLTARKLALDARIAAARKKQGSLAEQANVQTVKVSAVVDQIRELEKENKGIETEMGEVRENIAVLEYRISTITRYKNRGSGNN